MSYQSLYNKIQSGKLTILDGGVGTELQKRGVAMAPGAWCGSVSLGNQDLLEKIHLDYIHAGAEIITANTFASSRIMLREAGFEKQFREINTIAVEAALNARDRSGRMGLPVAGSLSHMIPVKPGTDRVVENGPSADSCGEAFEELAMLLLELGCDFIMLEMMYHPRRIRQVVKAAGRTGLPVWAGFSLGTDERGDLVSFGDPQFSAGEVFQSIEPDSVEVMGLMHTAAPLISPGLEVLRKHWSGPVAVYPDSGYFKMPDWQFEKILNPAEFQDFSKRWAAEGATILGGCCGLGPEHIALLQELKVR
jgi:S-methylmethionine-dependent homocysteine/selenocysteine methylase